MRGLGAQLETLADPLSFYYGVFSPVPVLYCDSSWHILRWGGQGWANNGWPKAWERSGGRVLGESLCKKAKKQSQHFIFYPITIFRFKF